MSTFNDDIYDILLKKNILPKEKLDHALHESKKSGMALFSFLLDGKYVDENVLLPLIADIMKVPYVNLKEINIDESTVRAIPVRFAWYYKFMPIGMEGNKIKIAVSSPLSVNVQDEIRLNLGFEISLVLAKKDAILESLKTCYGLGSDTVDQMIAREDKGVVHDVPSALDRIEDIEKLAGEASVISLVNQIIFEAYKKRATDIHIEPFRGTVKVRYRIDGVLYDQNVPEEFNRFFVPILSRIKIMSNLNIVERRIPQDGRAIVKTQEQVLDLRVSFIPTPHGESVVIRILPTKMLFSLVKLGLAEQNLDIIESLIKRPNGIIFVTGPTGSGKTTTLYACLERINRKEKKVVTIEDPIEYEVPGTTQIQVIPQIGLTFAQGLKSMLRHDPDIMMVGEVRDRETAEIAIRVALTGHLVFSTLHTNDAASGVTRLIDIGIEPYLVTSSVIAFIAQRLIRIICPHCKVEDKDADPEMKKKMASSLGGDPGSIKIYKGRGCEQCNFTGFYGRTAIYEILLVDQNIRKLIAGKWTASDIKKQAIKNGMKTLLQNGWEKVMQGLTTPGEVLNVCHDSGAEYEDDMAVEEKAGPSPGSTVQLKEADTIAVYPDEKRIYMRMPIDINVHYKLIEKGKGEIVRLTQGTEWARRDNILSRIFEETITNKDTSEVYEDVLSTSVNMSAGGLAFKSQYLVPPGSILELKIELPESKEAITTLSKVVRVEKDLPKCFYIAVCYLDMAGADRNTINTFVKKELTKQTLINLDK